MAQEAGLVGFDVGDPSDSGKGAGRPAIPRHLLGALSGTDAGNIQSLAVFIDNNGDPNEAMAFGKQALADCGFIVPDPPAILTTQGRRVGLYLIPEVGRRGTLEDLLLDAVFDADPHLRACVDAFISCTKIPSGWQPNQQAKMKLEAIIAAHCARNPQCPLHCVWQEMDNPIPRNSPRFDGVRSFLRSLAQ